MGNTINIDKYVGIGFRGIIPSAIDPSAAAYFTATGITGATQKTAIDNLVKGLKADGLWSKMKAVYPFVTDNRNLLGYTEDFGNAYWGKNAGLTVTANTTTAPNGTLTADTISISGIDKALYSPQVSTALGVVMKISFYIKATSGQQGNTVYVRTPWSEVGQFITLTSEWIRHEINYTTNGATYGVEWSNKNSATATSFYLWGAQLELGSTATTYQPIATTQQAFISSQFKYNLVNPVDSDAAFRLVFNGGWTHSSNGATPNGTNGYADTKLNDSILTPNSSHMSYYSRTNVLAGTYDIGAFNGTKGIWFGLRNQIVTGFFTGGIFQTGTSGEASVANSDSRGYYVGGKNGNTTVKFYKNGANVVSIAKADATATNTSIYLASLNQNGTPSFGFSTKQCAFSTIGDGLLDAEAAALYSHVQNFQLALNRAV